MERKNKFKDKFLYTDSPETRDKLFANGYELFRAFNDDLWIFKNDRRRKFDFEKTEDIAFSNTIFF